MQKDNAKSINSIGLADNPMVITINIGASDFPTGAAFRQLVVEVVFSDNVRHRFSAETDNSQSVTFDVSSAFRSHLFSEYMRDLSLTQKANGNVSADVIAHLEYIQDGELNSTTSVALYEPLIAIAGGLSESCRLFAGYTDPASILVNNYLMTTKPADGEVVNVGDTILTSTYRTAYHNTYTYVTSASTEGALTIRSTRHVYVESNPDRHEFFFLNSLGVFENASAVSLESLSYKSATEEKSIVNTPSFLPKPTLMAVHSAPRGEWKMSSGYVPREWADWWTTEFLAARRHWLRIPAAVPDASTSGLFLPVSVTPDAESTVIYDRTGQQLVSVNFTVKSAVTGPARC